MGGLSKVIVIDPDDRARRQLQLGFAREGVATLAVALPSDAAALELPVEDAAPGAVVVGGRDGHALAVLKRVRAVLEERQHAVPIVFAGRGVGRSDAETAGANEVLLLPAYLRDVITVARLVLGKAPASLGTIGGSLAEITGVLTLVRAMAALGRSAVLTMIRGLRRGEVRFYHGEVTSAQVGLIHGQAALHQLLLWTDARFEYRHEDVVRRQQIPMEHDELFADAERFLAGVRESSGSLSPSMVLEQDVPRVQTLGKQIPTEVYGVLRMFDGHRVLADVLEDSPYRVFETLRVAQRAMDVGLLRAQSATRKKATWRAVLAIEEWLVGSEAPERVPGAEEVGPLTQTASRDSQRMKAPGGGGGKRKKGKKRRHSGPMPVAMPASSSAAGSTPLPTSLSRTEIDWGSLVPREVGAEVGPLAGVVPASKASGEIMLPTRDEPREGLESVMNTAKRERLFASDLAAPSVVLGDPKAAVPTAPAEPVARDTPGVVATETPSATVLVADRMTVHHTDHTARLVSEPLATVMESRAPADVGRSADSARLGDGTPTELADDASDGIPRAGTPAIETAPLESGSRPARVPTPVDDDRPEAKTGEIAHRTARPSRPPAQAPTEPSILIAELPSVQTTATPVAIATARTEPTKRALKAARAAARALDTSKIEKLPAEKPVPADKPAARESASEVAKRPDVVAVFSDIEEDFFRAGQTDTAAIPRQPSESFDDLDAGYQKPTFWGRLVGKKPKR